MPVTAKNWMLLSRNPIPVDYTVTFSTTQQRKFTWQRLRKFDWKKKLKLHLNQTRRYRLQTPEPVLKKKIK